MEQRSCIRNTLVSDPAMSLSILIFAKRFSAKTFFLCDEELPASCILFGYKLKLKVTVPTTRTGTPPNCVGVNFYPNAAFSAAAFNKG